MAEINFDISEYEYSEINGNKSKNEKAHDYTFQDLADLKVSKKLNADKRNILCLKKPSKPLFKISPVVKKYSGILANEEKEREEKISNSVEIKVSEIYEKAFNAGKEEGIRAGKKEVYEQLREDVDEKLTLLSSLIDEAINFKPQLIEAQKQQLYIMVKNLTKWVILRELEEDGNYIQRLLEKLILEIQTKENLLIKVSNKYYQKIPEVIEQIELNLGNLTNVRIESNYDVCDKGIILESENGIIDACLSEQLDIISEMFDSVLNE